MSARRPQLVLLLALTLTTAVAGCSTAPTQAATEASSGSSEPVTVYSGRAEALIQPLLSQLESNIGAPIEVRYGDSSELAAQLLEEGERTQADLFFSQDAGALSALGSADRLDGLEPEITGMVEPGFADQDGHWVATSARARVVAYDPRQAPEAAEFTGIDAILDPRYRGKVGFAPTNASFHSFVTALRVIRGEDAAREWLTRFKANEPKAYDKNGAVLNAVDAGQVSLGLINHYYWHALVAEKGADQVNAQIRFLGAGDPGGLINVAGVGILRDSAQKPQAVALVKALLAPSSQQYFADQTAEYPVVAGVSTSRHQLPQLSSLKSANLDLNALDSLPGTLTLLAQVGLT